MLHSLPHTHTQVFGRVHHDDAYNYVMEIVDGRVAKVVDRSGFEWQNTSGGDGNEGRSRVLSNSLLFDDPFAAVKFGRMSKKQREKVEDEVRYHRAQMKAQQAETSPDSSVFDNQQPSSSDQLAPYPTG